MKEFDIELAKAGHPVCTRDGKPARIICYDSNITFGCIKCPIVALVENKDKTEFVRTHTIEGYLVHGEVHDDDLVMVTEHHEGWVNVYRHNGSIYDVGAMYKSEGDAVAHGKAMEDVYVKTIKIEWED